MKKMQHIIEIFFLFSIVTIGLGETLELYNNGDGTWNVEYVSEDNISGFQFDVDGVTVNVASGGAAEEADFSVTSDNNRIIGNTSLGETIPAGNGILVVLELSGEPTGLTGFLISDSSGISINFTYSAPGCMDDGYQQWSPNPGSPACNYDPFAIIEGECLYNDCNGLCGGTADIDCSDSCLEENDTSWDSSCEDCFFIPNGSAYFNACQNCVGGDTGILDDCFILEKESNSLYYSDSVYTIQVFANNLVELQSIDIEFQYDVKLLEMTDFSIYGTALWNQGYEIIYDSTIVEEPNLMETKLTIFFNPPNSTYNPIEISPNENIFNIQLETKFILTDSEATEIKINTISLNENSIYIGDWGEWTILLTPVTGCTDPDYCNYNSLATLDDGSCWSPIEGCTCSDGEGAVINECNECEVPQPGTGNCLCGQDDNKQLDCNGDCPPDECPGELSFVEGCAFRDECNVCVGGATERIPCEKDCTGEWGGTAYEDNCDQCIAELDDIDCFSASFKIYSSTGNEVENSTIIETENIYVALFLQNLPNSFEGIILNLEYNSNFLSLNNWSFNPSELESEGELASDLDNSNELFVSVDSTIVDSTIFTAVMYATNEPYQGNSGNILLLEFAQKPSHLG